MREVFDGAVQAGRHALAALGHGTAEIDAALAEFARQDQRMLDELAALWRPDVSAEQNAAYLALERKQAAVIEAALRAAVARGKEAGGARAPPRELSRSPAVTRARRAPSRRP